MCEMRMYRYLGKVESCSCDGVRALRERIVIVCGLCGFGLTDAQLLLELDETKPLELTDDLAETGDRPLAADSTPPNAKPNSHRAERRAAKRPFYALIGRVVAILRDGHKRETHAAHGL
jgi:hypothetical protein